MSLPRNVYNKNQYLRYIYSDTLVHFLVFRLNLNVIRGHRHCFIRFIICFNEHLMIQQRIFLCYKYGITLGVMFNIEPLVSRFTYPVCVQQVSVTCRSRSHSIQPCHWRLYPVHVYGSLCHANATSSRPLSGTGSNGVV